MWTVQMNSICTFWSELFIGEVGTQSAESRWPPWNKLPVANDHPDADVHESDQTDGPPPL